MAMLEELALKRRTFNDDDRLKRDHAEGAIIHSIPAAVFIVRDHFISTVCSGCLKTPIQHSQRTNPLQQCSRCKYLRYCSADCQTRDWKKCHKTECGMLEAVWKACPNQDTSFARLFVRTGLKNKNDLRASGLPSLPCFILEGLAVQEAHQRLKLYHLPQNCRTLFSTWMPILEALDWHYGTDQQQFCCFMNTLTDLIGISMPIFEVDCKFSQEPIAYCTFLNNSATPLSLPNAVFLPVIDSVHGVVLHIKAVRPIKAGEVVICAEANNLLVSPVNLRAEGTYVRERAIRETMGRMASVKGDELKDLISTLRPMVANTSFALGILYRELADVCEKLGRMGKCVEAYKLMIPIVEKHIHKYDQNILDGLSRVIVYHLERQEITESLPYIEKAWERLQIIPGKDSFDFHVVDKLRKAIQNWPDFTFSEFCCVEPGKDLEMFPD